jgi:hypothetical protein
MEMNMFKHTIRFEGRVDDMDWDVFVLDSDGDVEYRLPPRNDLIDHSPDGFAWGYGGSGPSQLALALVAFLLQDDEEAKRWYQEFKWEFVAKLPKEQFWEASLPDLMLILAEMGAA